MNTIRLVLATSIATAAMGFSARADLPRKYIELECVTVYGDQWIDTGVHPSDTLRMDLRFLPFSNNESYLGSIDPTETSEIWERFNFWNGKALDLVVGLWNSTTPVIMHGGGWVDASLDAENARVVINNITNSIDRGGRTFHPESNSAIRYGGRSSTQSDKVQKAFGRLGPATFWESGRKIREFVPCVRADDKCAGFYDLVGGKFYKNAGTGTFEPGDIKVKSVLRLLPTDYRAFSYLQSDGDSVIDTGIHPSDNLAMQLKLMLVKDKNEYQIGSINSDRYQHERFHFYYQDGAFTVGLWAQIVLNSADLKTAFDSGNWHGLTMDAYNSRASFGTDASRWYFEGVSKGDNTFYPDTNCTIWLFGRNSEDESHKKKGPSKIAYAVFYESGVMNHLMIPCQRKKDGEYGFYDVYDQTGTAFHAKVGTSAFIPGEEIARPPSSGLALFLR